MRASSVPVQHEACLREPLTVLQPGGPWNVPQASPTDDIVARLTSLVGPDPQNRRAGVPPSNRSNHSSNQSAVQPTPLHHHNDWSALPFYMYYVHDATAPLDDVADLPAAVDRLESGVHHQAAGLGSRGTTAPASTGAALSSLLQIKEEEESPTFCESSCSASSF